jgi:uncharacterized protein YutE (UPF0331/DUF86 family)
MVRRDVAARKIARAAAWLDQAEALLATPLPAFLSDARDRDLAAFYLMLAVQEAIDLAAHGVADAGWAPPDDAGSAFEELAEHALIDRPLADALHQASASVTASHTATGGSIMRACTPKRRRGWRRSARFLHV